MEGWRDGRLEGWRDGRLEGWRDGSFEFGRCAVNCLLSFYPSIPLSLYPSIPLSLHPSIPLAPRAVSGENFYVEGERSLVTRVQRANAHDVTRELFAFLVPHRDQDGVFPRLTGIRVRDRALDLERRKSRDRACRGPGIET